MFKLLGNIMVVVLILFAFVGQSVFAFSMPCDMSDSLHQDHMMDMDKGDIKNITMHEMSADMHASMAMEDCCNDDCSCPENACASAVLLLTHQKIHNTRSSFDKIYTVNITAINYHQKSLYRPPILT